ncbi:MAG: hypothetical protein MUC81_02345 [Bacteroidia bacterium]|jgi:hypothetical protein|nr:hypothetical protein [Bacteroidia bacterium]
MKKLFIIINIIIIVTNISFAQQLNLDNFKGKWKGMMISSNKGIINDSVPVVFELSKADDSLSWNWIMDYKSEKLPVTKKYMMNKVSTNPHLFILNEGDGVEITYTRYGNKIISIFETSGVILVSTYEFIGDTIISEIISGRKGKNSLNGVINHQSSNVQRIVLTRQ